MSPTTQFIYGALGTVSLAMATSLHNYQHNHENIDIIWANQCTSFILGLIVPIMLCMDYMRRYVTAEPDQWQLLIRNGQLVDAGIGSCHFKGIFDKVVKFPSGIQKCSFRVEQVTSEMQGVVVNGFALWTVHREGEGPWKAYKNLQLRDIDEDGNIDTTTGNEHIKAIATSIIRVTIAQLSLAKCLKDRDEIRSKVREQMMEQLVGWGVWLETVEISDVLVASRTLFEDMQCEFRNDQRIKAERVRLTTERALQQEKIIADLDQAKKRAEAETAKEISISQQSLLREQKQAELLVQQQEVREQKILIEEAIEQSNINSQKRLNEMKIQNKIHLSMLESDALLQRQQAQDQRTSQLNEKSLVCMQMEHCKEVYNKVKEIKINSFVSGSTTTGSSSSSSSEYGTNPSNILPGLGALSTTAAQWEVIRNGQE